MTPVGLLGLNCHYSEWSGHLLRWNIHQGHPSGGLWAESGLCGVQLWPLDSCLAAVPSFNSGCNTSGVCGAGAPGFPSGFCLNAAPHIPAQVAECELRAAQCSILGWAWLLGHAVQQQRERVLEHGAAGHGSMVQQGRASAWHVADGTFGPQMPASWTVLMYVMELPKALVTNMFFHL